MLRAARFAPHARNTTTPEEAPAAQKAATQEGMHAAGTVLLIALLW